MATVNIGNLSFTHKGDYASGTAYVKNDVVYYSTNGNAYIAKQATTGNAPTNGTYWSQFAAGSGGIWNAGLSLGSAGQAVKVNTAGNALEFGTIQSDFVKLAGVDYSSSSATEVDFAQFMDDSVYSSYLVRGNFVFTSNGNSIRARFLNNTSAYSGGADYVTAGYQLYREVNHASGSQIGASVDGNGKDYIQVYGWGANNGVDQYFEINIWGMPTTSGRRVGATCKGFGKDNSSNPYIFYDENGGFLDNTGVVDGIKLYNSGGSALGNFRVSIYGMKK